MKDIDILSPVNFLTDGIRKDLDNLILSGPDGKWTWNEFFKESIRIGSILEKSGIEYGDRVAYLSDSDEKGFSMLFGIWMAGGVASPLNTAVPLHVAKEIIEILQPRFLLFECGTSTPDYLPSDVEPVQIQSDSIESVSFEPTIVDSNESAIVLFTSGSTGRPKGVVSSHKALALNAIRMSDILQLTSSDRILINTPHYYTSAICHFLTMMSRGAGLVFKKGFLFWENFVQEVERYSCTGFGGAPTHFIKIFSGGHTNAFKTLRFLISSGDHLPDDVAFKAIRAIPHISVYRVYGLSEVSGRLSVLPPQSIGIKPECAGLPLPGMKVGIVREDCTIAAPGEIGEIHVTGDMLSERYFNDEKASEELHTQWGFRTGDIGFMDDDGYIYISGRKDDVFKSGGEKVSCIVIQQELMKLGCFSDVAVLPVVDDILGKIPMAYVVMTSGISFDKIKVINCLRGKLSKTHIPRRFKIVPTIPRTGSGKIIRGELALLNSIQGG